MMMSNTSLALRWECCCSALVERGLDSALRWWENLDNDSKDRLLKDIESTPWMVIDDLLSTHVLNKPEFMAVSNLSPARAYGKTLRENEPALYDQAVRAGKSLLRDGKVAAMTVAGGQGTRLGMDGPKGAVVVTPTGNKTLFEIFAEMVKAASARYQSVIPWYIMTSTTNHHQTLSFFEAHDYFGLAKQDVIFFTQGMLPVFDFQGQLLLASKDRLALAPDGHGGSLQALAVEGCLTDMQRRGIEVMSYFQVDNPLVKPFDPLFLGLHKTTGSEMSTKVTTKADDLERVGNLCLREGKLGVVEYSDFPEALAREKNPQGSRKYNWANLAIHLIDVAFVDRIVGQSFQLPYRRAEKIVEFVDDQGIFQKPATPNAIKLETFVFDAIPLANNPMLLEVDRAEEFSPVKNATGVDSLETSIRDQSMRACRWLEQAGVEVPRLKDGSPAVTVTLSPMLALEMEDVREHLDRLPQLQPGGSYDII